MRAREVESEVVTAADRPPPGPDDRLIPVSQSRALAARLRKVGVATRLEIVTRGDHGLIAAGQSLSHDAIARLAADFLAEHLSAVGLISWAGTRRDAMRASRE